jgi:steroid delta-isomerase-like uncharacterized protein
MTATAIEAFRAGTEAFNDHDIDAFAEVLADDVAFDAPGAQRGTGKAACAAFYRGWLEAFPDAHVDVAAAHVCGDVVVEEGTFRGTHRGALRTPAGDIPPTGARVAVPYVHVLRFRDGKHAALGLVFDRLLMLEQLGLAPAPAGR